MLQQEQNETGPLGFYTRGEEKRRVMQCLERGDYKLLDARLTGSGQISGCLFNSQMLCHGGVLFWWLLRHPQGDARAWQKQFLL
jgi:hypothetical protein